MDSEQILFCKLMSDELERQFDSMIFVILSTYGKYKSFMAVDDKLNEILLMANDTLFDNNTNRKLIQDKVKMRKIGRAHV